MATPVETGSATPFTEPGALGIPVSGFLDDFTGEGCDDAPQQLRFELHDTESDGTQIVRLLAQLSKAYAKNECIIYFARCLVGGNKLDDDRTGQFRTIASWCLKFIVYQADPRGIEFVRSPVQMLKEWYKNGVTMGDCDDHTLLLNSLLGALGIATQVQAVALPGSPDPNVMNHVLSRVDYGKGWRDFDACNKSDPFFMHTGAKIIA